MTFDIKPLPVTTTSKTLDDLPEIILGAGVFNYQYHSDPLSLPADQVIRRAFDLGIRALDTSAYYGPSESIVGEALSKIENEAKGAYKRDSYFICTKAGREKADLFEYKPEQIRSSVNRSLRRLRTDYIDILYIHDVEFVETKKCLEAIGEAFRLKQDGLVRYVGISGYPVDFLLYLAKKVQSDIGESLDVVLSYSNFCIQNTTLGEFSERFSIEAGVKRVLNASPLSMSLLRSGETHSFHPASDKLKENVSKAAEYTASKGVELADLASRFAFRHWSGSTVFGLQRIEEVDRAVNDYWQSKDPQVTGQDESMIEKVREILGDTLDLTWASGIEHADMLDV